MPVECIIVYDAGNYFYRQVAIGETAADAYDTAFIAMRGAASALSSADESALRECFDMANELFPQYGFSSFTDTHKYHVSLKQIP